ncbi:SprT family protein [Paenibacillus mendelii]|uniref:SprT family protein n=1 Tax=Paenibacillus mendelii TaxID=206163 RepID=A0ABV6JMV6_9BACL|nr:SprT family protein [Paenibacillus mendelii]MCQ6558809.1 SprT family protein [Paenibacillus mendelii]
MTDDKLQAWVERVSMQYFKLPFRHLATFNRRLRSTGGRYFTKSHNIEISPHQLENYGEEETEKIIKHELCHYHLHLLKRGYKHRDADFKQLLAHVGGSRFCKSLPGRELRKAAPYRYKLVCRNCGMEYLRKRKIDPNRYACGTCRGKLLLFMLDSAIES